MVAGNNETVSLENFYPSDIFGFSSRLTTGELTVLKHVREVVAKKIKPVLNKHWEQATFPMAEFQELAKVRIMDNPLLFEEQANKELFSDVYDAHLVIELAKIDVSLATFYTVHGGLCYQTIMMGGNQAQIDKYASKLRSFEYQGCFGLTEPDHGSDVAGGLTTTAEKRDGKWYLSGEKRWIGGASTADILPIFAKDVTDNKVKCFIVKKGAPGMKIENVPQKIALRLVQNGHIFLDNVEVEEVDRLEKINSFRDVQKILTRTRAHAAHIATGASLGAFEATLNYTTNRDQFGKKIANYQLVQEKLALMHANVVAALSYSAGIVKLQEKNRGAEEISALTKMHNALRLRENVAMGRELCGGNGITLETDIARFFVDAEAVYTYEGTHQINSLIVGRKLTGMSAFT